MISAIILQYPYMYYLCTTRYKESCRKTLFLTLWRSVHMFNVQCLDVDYNSSTLDAEISQRLAQYGVCVINNVFSPEESIAHRNHLIGDFLKLCDGVTGTATWTQHNMIPQMMAGQIKSYVCNTKTMWDLRKDQRLKRIFTIAYECDSDAKMIPSIDGANILPPGIAYTDDLNNPRLDWSHLDCTDGVKFVQGQVVLNRSSGAFRCSPCSHLLFNEIKNLFNIDDHVSRFDHNSPMRNWYKFPNKHAEDIEKIKQMEKMIEDIGGKYQIPIYAPPGSVIIWLSTCIHSSKFMSRDDTASKGAKNAKKSKDPYDMWRCVSYISLRKYDDYSHMEEATRAIIRENGSTNHRGDKNGRDEPNENIYCKKVNEIIKDPKSVYYHIKHVPDENDCVL